MRFVFYTHSLISDWNHGNVHFLRGIMRELLARGHETFALEPQDGWSRTNLLKDQGFPAVERFRRDFPELRTHGYGVDFDHETALADADVVIVHEWTDPALVARIGHMRRDGAGFILLFHDTHHRAVSEQEAISALMLEHYDGVLAFGEALRQRYLDRGWGPSVFTWHEAADDRLCRPHPEAEAMGDLIWIGNWGDEERTAEIEEFLIEPAASLGLKGTVRGVRYPEHAKARLAAAGFGYGGWIANADVPLAFARHRVTVHIPRRPYVEALPGIPTIRVFEALASGVPLISAPWEDCEHLFRPGNDFLFARDGKEMKELLRMVIHDHSLRATLIDCGMETIKSRHTCRHRVDELLRILAQMGTAHTASQPVFNEAAQ